MRRLSPRAIAVSSLGLLSTVFAVGMIWAQANPRGSTSADPFGGPGAAEDYGEAGAATDDPFGGSGNIGPAKGRGDEGYAGEGVGIRAKASSKRPAGEELILRVYRVGDLIQTVPDYPYRPGLPNGLQRQDNLNQPGGGVIMPGAAAAGETGFFQVPPRQLDANQPEHVLHQFGGTPGMMGGMGPVGGDRFVANDQSAEISVGGLVQTIESVVAPESWVNGGGNGICEILGQMLVVRQTAAIHQEIEALLAALRAEGGVRRTVHVEACWVETNNEEAASGLRRSLALVNTRPNEQNLMEFWARCRENTRHSGEINCHTGQTVHFCTGETRSVIENATPTVGFSAVAYQPHVSYVNIGMVFQVKPTLDPGGEHATLDLFSTVNALPTGESQPLKISTEFIGAENEQGVKGRDGRSQVEIDRTRLVTRHLATTIRVPVGFPKLVGSVHCDAQDTAAAKAAGAAPKTGPQNRRQLHLIVWVAHDPLQPMGNAKK